MIIIVGAGLSGLLTAYRLKEKGIAFKILEARARIGGRINTLFGDDNTTVEMGATWFGDQHQQVLSLLKELEIPYFEQYMKGTVFFQQISNSPAQAIQIPSQPPSYRISGGTSRLINALYSKLDEKEILFENAVTSISFHDHSVEVRTQNELFEADKVVLAIPPKLWAKKISFLPRLPEDLLDIANNTHTWMEDSIKVALTYRKPFWEQQGLSGTLFSNSGPITEFYDHSNHERTKYALCGFVASSFKQLDIEMRKQKVLEQLENVFGDKALDFLDYEECIWSSEENTYINSEETLFPHQNNGHPIFRKSYMNDRLFISSAEAASEFPGYMDGAIRSANYTVQKLLISINS